jgi:ubiquinol-cytochrome c reductase cytochrome c1 subunit
MTRNLIVFLAGLLLSGSALAAGGGNLQQAGNDLGDQASLQRGAALYMNYCSGCHSLKYVRYARLARDLGLSEDQVQASLNFTGAKVGEQVHTAMAPADAQAWFGQVPPDLTLVSRVRGSDWVYTYLKSFYLDDERPLGWNNTLFPNASMPNPLWMMQGLQRAEYGAADEATGERPVERLVVDAPGSVAPEAYDRAVRDITNFLEYVGEPAALQRQSLGVWVILFLAFFTFLAWLLKKEYWRDVH